MLFLCKLCIAFNLVHIVRLFDKLRLLICNAGVCALANTRQGQLIGYEQPFMRRGFVSDVLASGYA